MSNAATVAQPAPFRFTEVWRQFVDVYRPNWLKLLGCAAIVQLPATVLSLTYSLFAIPQMSIFQPRFNNFVSPQSAQQMMVGLATSMLLICAMLIVSIILPVFTLTISQGAATYLVTGSILDKPISLMDAIRRSLKVWPRTSKAYLTCLLIGLALGLWAIVPCVGWLTGPGAAMAYSVVSYLVVPVAVLENEDKGSFYRSWQLVRRQFWWVIGLITAGGFALGVFYVVLSQSIYSASNLLTGAELFAPIPPASPTFAAVTIIYNLILLPVSLIYLSGIMAFMLVIYFYLRTRLEGLDLASLRTQASPEAALPAPPPAAPSQRITNRELGYFVAISVAVVILYACLYAIIFITTVAERGSSGLPL